MTVVLGLVPRKLLAAYSLKRRAPPGIASVVLVRHGIRVWLKLDHGVQVGVDAGRQEAPQLLDVAFHGGVVDVASFQPFGRPFFDIGHRSRLCFVSALG